jgi:hypothetical protein
MTKRKVQVPTGIVLNSNVDPNPPVHLFLGFLDQDPLVSGMDPDQDADRIRIRIRIRIGSGSFYHSAKIVRKTLISTVLLRLFDFLSLKSYVNVPSKSNMQKNC